VFSTDLEEEMQTPQTEKTSKPLKALEKVLELIEHDKVTGELCDMIDFLATRMKS
jgi:hypothetical protein